MSKQSLIAFLNFLENNSAALDAFNGVAGDPNQIIDGWERANGVTFSDEEKGALVGADASALYHMIREPFSMPAGPPTSDPGARLLAIAPEDPPTSSPPPVGARRTVKRPAKKAPKPKKATKRPKKTTKRPKKATKRPATKPSTRSKKTSRRR